MTYIIAEIGNNHNGNIDKCVKLIKAAHSSGANAVKFQSFRGLDIVNPRVLATDYPAWDSKGYKYWYEFLDSIALPLESHQDIINYSNKLGMDFITTPVTPEIVSMLENLDGIKSYKIASMDLNNYDLLHSISKTNKSVILSTGMGSIEEIEDAVKILSKENLSIMHCISDYPLNPSDSYLNNIRILKKYFPNNIIGLSDHSLGHEIAILAVSLGAKIIEKHFTLDRNDPNAAEHHFSMEPNEFKKMTKWIGHIEDNLSYSSWKRSENENKVIHQYRRSFHYKKDLKKGHILKKTDIIYLRPGNGIDFTNLNKVINKSLKKYIKAYDPCLEDDFI